MWKRLKNAALPATLATVTFNEDDDAADSDYEVELSSESEEVQASTSKKQQHFDVDKEFDELKANEARLAAYWPPCRKLDPQMLSALFGHRSSRRGKTLGNSTSFEPFVGPRKLSHGKGHDILNQFELNDSSQLRAVSIEGGQEQIKIRLEPNATKIASEHIIGAREKLLQDDTKMLNKLHASHCCPLAEEIKLDVRKIKQETRSAAAPYLASMLSWEKPGNNKSRPLHPFRDHHNRLLDAVATAKTAQTQALPKKMVVSDDATEGERQRAAHMRMKAGSLQNGAKQLPSLPRCVHGITRLSPNFEVESVGDVFEIEHNVRHNSAGRNATPTKHEASDEGLKPLSDEAHPLQQMKSSAASRPSSESKNDARVRLEKGNPRVSSTSSVQNTIQESPSKQAVGMDIGDGCHLVCIGDDCGDSVPVFASPQSESIVRHIAVGESVIASNPPLAEDGFLMVPILPCGAVQIDFFELVSSQQEVQEPDMQTHVQSGMAVEVAENVDPAWEAWERQFAGEKFYQQLRPWLHARAEDDFMCDSSAISQSAQAWKKAKIHHGITNELQLHSDYGALDRIDFIEQAVANENIAFRMKKRQAESATARGLQKRQEAGSRLVGD